MVLNKDFKEFIKLLNQNNVKYLVVGGYALAFHGHPRYTKDLDIWVLANNKNSLNIINSLDQFGFTTLGLSTKDFIQQGQVIQLGYPPTRIDILTSASGVSFNECFDSKIVIQIEDINVNFINIENLIKNKQATGRLQDLADIEKLQ